MKIFLLVVLFILLINRIKNTPSMLSKTLYMKKMQKAIDKQKDANIDKEIEGAVKGAAILFALLLETLFVIFYIVLGNKIGGTFIIVLSALQVVTCFYSTGKIFSGKVFSHNIEDFKFYRLYFLFNVALDYVYYPVAIHMLLVK